MTIRLSTDQVRQLDAARKMLKNRLMHEGPAAAWSSRDLFVEEVLKIVGQGDPCQLSKS